MKERIIAWREFKAMMREKSFALILVFEILLVSSSAFLSVGYNILTSPESSEFLEGMRNVVYVGLVTESRREFSQPLQRAGIAYFQYDSLLNAEDDLRSGVLDAVIIGDVDLRDEHNVITVYMPSNTPKMGLIRLSLKRFFLDVEERLRNVKMLIYTPDLELLEYEEAADTRTARHFEVFYIFTVPLLFFMPAIMAGSLMVDSLSEEFESKRILNLVTAPLKYKTIVYGKCLAAFAVTLPHCLIWLALLSFTDFKPHNPLGILAAFTLYTCFFIAAGAATALRVRGNRGSQMTYTVLAVASIALFSPSANAFPALLKFSPAHVLTNLALGAGTASMWWQFTVLLALTAAAAYVMQRESDGLRSV